MTDFYMTLFSNSSMDFYKENTTSTFTVQLPRTMTLNGEWRVALSEIHYPYSFLNVQKGQNQIKIKSVVVTQDVLNYIKSEDSVSAESIESKFDVKWITCKIEPGFYSDTVKLISAVNKAITEVTENSNFFKLDEKANTVQAEPNDVSVVGKIMILSVKMSDRLSLQLGYIPNKPITEVNSGGFHPVNLISGIPDKMLIYCDIIEPQICGDICAKLLRTVTVSPDGVEPYFGYPCCKEFTQLQYIPLQMKNFESISIAIKDITSEPTSFTYGTLSVKLHFKQF